MQKENLEKKKLEEDEGGGSGEESSTTNTTSGIASFNKGLKNKRKRKENVLKDVNK